MGKEKTDIAPDLVREQLQMILNCDEMKHSQILARFLEFVVVEKLSGREDEIKEYTIGVKALGRSSDFNPQLDAIVRIHAGRLRRTLYEYYSNKGKNDSLLIHIPKGTYIPEFAMHHNGDIEDLPLLVTPPEELVVHIKEMTNGHIHGKPLLAILPFHNLSPENSMDYFVAGIGEQLSVDLARFQNIAVISYYSTLKYDCEVKDLHELKETMHVDYVITGSIRILDEMLRLNVQLLFSENGEIIWTETYVRHLTPHNLFDIQEEMASQILNVIADDFGVIIKYSKTITGASSQTESAIVYNAVFKYYDYFSDHNRSKFAPAFGELEHAQRLAPENALVSAMLADLYLDIYVGKVEQEPELLEKAMELARTAVAIENNCQHAQKTMAWCLLFLDKKDRSLDVIDFCIGLNPKAASMISSMGLLLVCLGEYSRGFTLLVRSMHLNLTLPITTKLGFAIFYYHENNYEKSLNWFEKITAPRFPFLLVFHLSIQGRIGYALHNERELEDLDIEGNAFSIINRFVIDGGLRSKIARGLQMAGLKVK